MGKNSPPSRRPESQQQSLTAVKTEFSGPLPHPNLLQQYEEICPGFAERIVGSWEKETSHRHDLEKMVVDAEIEGQRNIPKEIKRGQWLAFTLSLLFLLVGGFLAYHGKEASGSIIGGAGFIGTITSFLTTAFQSRNNNSKG